MCAGPVRTRGGAPTDKPDPPCVVGAPSGCECVPDRFAPGAVLLQTSLPTSCCRSTLWVRMCDGPVRTGGGAPTNEAGTTPYCRSTRPGCECVPDRFAPRRCSYKQTVP